MDGRNAGMALRPWNLGDMAILIQVDNAWASKAIGDKKCRVHEAPKDIEQ